MRIKHWSGYGCVNARKINDGQAKLHVRVEGIHERGVKRDTWDASLLCNWLVKRFDKSVTDTAEWYKKHPVIDCTENFRMDPKVGYVEVVDYYFWY